MPIAEVERVQPDDEPPFPVNPGPPLDAATDPGHGLSEHVSRVGGHLLVLAAIVAVVFAYLGRGGSGTDPRETSLAEPVSSRSESTVDDPSGPELAPSQGATIESLAGPSWAAGTSAQDPVGSTTADLEMDRGSGSSDLSTTAGRSPGTTDRASIKTTNGGATTSTTGSPSSTSSRSATTRRATTSTASVASTTRPPPSVPDEVDWALGSAGTVSSPVLPLDGPLRSGALTNYDADRDDAPGLLVQKGGGPGETDPVKVQRWWLDLPAGAELVGRPVLRQWAALKDFDEAKTGRLEVRLYDCAAVRSDCRLVTTGQASVRQATFGSSFGLVTVSLAPVEWKVAAGRGVALEVTVSSSSDDDLWLAYGTQTHDSRFIIDRQ